ncbi:hypothetical protein [Desulfosporosinus nitroreducens]|uniref:hypothetical protein n=1 Tax=Desulfosporosinus nitroreducens TaxID=2018668 RepID=UPI00207D2F00|nr:hypothetical protein [Desulfosporosinus nitroreducens]MCO1601017.1 hypothetical protein [Desulfosporosinus nitroreducens]
MGKNFRKLGWRQAKGDGHGWPSVPVAMDGEKGPQAAAIVALMRWPWMAECPCSHGWREGALESI